MQYFQYEKETCGKWSVPQIGESKLLFYLVTGRFAQWLSDRREEKFAIECKRAGVTRTSRYRSTLMSQHKYRIISG